MAPPSSPEQFMKLPAAAAILNVSIKTLRRRIKAGELPVIRDGRILRIRPKDLQNYIATHRCE